MKNLLELAKVQAVRVGTSATVMDAIGSMADATVGAVLIMEGQELRGIFTERDVMLRVVQQKRDPETTVVTDVMTSPVMSVAVDKADPEELLRTMSERHIRHLVVLDTDGGVAGMVSMRLLLQRKIEDLTREMDSLGAYLAADGIGG